LRDIEVEGPHRGQAVEPAPAPEEPAPTA
jgi:hypothetical protein